MASFTGVDDNVELSVADVGEDVTIADDATHTSGTGTFTGTVKFLWINLGTVAA